MLTVEMTRPEIARLIDRLWEDPEPGLIWEERHKQDEVCEIGRDGADDNLIEETWHTPRGTIVATSSPGSGTAKVEVRR